jgi:peptidyl-prolyl cis-trans isomerase D
MATLEKIRKKAGLLVAVVGVALFAFIIGDLLNSGSSFMHRNQNNIIIVNGEAVDYQEYMIKENDLTEVYKLQTGTQSLNESYLTQLRQMLYEEIVMDKVLDPRLEKLGLIVTPEEMTDMVEGENISPVLLQIQMFLNPQTGAYDRNAVLTLLNQIKNMDGYPEEAKARLKQAKTMWMFWEKNIRQNRKNEKYITLLTKAITANSLDAKYAYDNSVESSDIIYVMEPFANIADSSVQVSSTEIQKLYNERKEMYRQDETCMIDYVSVDIVPSQEDYDNATKEADEIREEMAAATNIASIINEKSETKYSNVYFSIAGLNNDKELIDFASSAEVGDIKGPAFKDNVYRIFKLIDKTVAPDSVFVSEITLSPRATEAETKAFADSLLNEINKGADFVELVKNYSADEQLAQNNGEIGWISELIALRVNEDYKNMAFSLPAGKSGIVKSNYGYHILKVKERTNNVAKYKIADMEYAVFPSSATRSKLFNDLNSFAAKNNTPEKFEASAPESGYNLLKNVRLFKSDIQIGNVTGARQVVRWAFNNKKDNISDIIECDDKYVVALNKGITPAGYQPIEQVSSQLKAEIAAKKKGEEIAANLKSKNLTSIDAYASAMEANPDSVKFISMETSRIAGIGLEPKLNALVSLAPVNNISEPLVGNNGVYVFEVLHRTFDNKPYNEKSQRTMIESNNSYRLGSSFMRFLQQKAKIEDNRYRFF